MSNDSICCVVEGKPVPLLRDEAGLIASKDPVLLDDSVQIASAKV